MVCTCPSVRLFPFLFFSDGLILFQLIKRKGFDFDVAFTSVLKRAIKTLYLIQDSTDKHWVPVQRSWRLNERHYGALQGLNKAETAAKHGEDQVKVSTLNSCLTAAGKYLLHPRASLATVFVTCKYHV